MTIAQKLKYSKEINGLKLSNCPGSSSIPRQIPAFRYGIDPVSDPKNIETEASILTRENRFPRKNASDDQLCSDFGLSFFDTKDNALNFWKNYNSRMKEKLGYNTLLELDIRKSDGLCTTTNPNGHFNLFEFETTSLAHRFKKVTRL